MKTPQIAALPGMSPLGIRPAMETRPIYEIARDIRANWPKVNYAALPYLDAMRELNGIGDKYIYDTGESVVRYFLSNASAWRGPEAKRIKAELNAMLKGGR